MEEDKKLTKKELKALRKLEKLDSNKESKKQNFMKWIVISLASILFLGFFVYIFTQAKETSQKAEIVISQNDQIKGNQNAKITMVEFSDFQCPACKTYEPLVQNLLKDFDGDLKLVYKHFPLPNHKNALITAYAAEAAGKQGKFWEMHDLLFEKQTDWSESDNAKELMVQYATTLNLDIEKFKTDIDSKEIKDKVQKDLEEGIANDVNATPTFYINNQKIENPGSYDEFKEIIQDNLELN